MDGRGSRSFHGAVRRVESVGAASRVHVRMSSSLLPQGLEVALRRGQPLDEILRLLARQPGFQNACAMELRTAGGDWVEVRSTADLQENDVLRVLLEGESEQALPRPPAGRPAPRPQPPAQLDKVENPLAEQQQALVEPQVREKQQQQHQQHQQHQQDQHQQQRQEPHEQQKPWQEQPDAHQTAAGSRNRASPATPSLSRGLDTAIHTSHAPVSSGLRQQTYLIAIYTAKESKADDVGPNGISPHTDATVRIKLHGANGRESEERILRPADQHADSLFPGCVDQFCITCVDLGDLSHITVGHDNDGKDAFTSRWKVDRVIVTCVSSQKKGKKGKGDHAMFSGWTTSKQWQFVLRDTDEGGGKWIGGASGGNLAAIDEEIQSLRKQIRSLEKKLAHAQTKRETAATGPGSTSPQMRKISVKYRKNNHKKEAACCYIIFFSLLGAFLGDFIAQEHELTAGVTFDVVDRAERTANRTGPLIDESVTSTVKVGWLIGVAVGLIFAVALWRTWSWVWRHKWQLVFCLSIAGQGCMFVLGFWRWIPDCIAEEGRARIDIINFTYEPLDRERLFLLVLFGGCMGMAALAVIFGPLSLRSGKKRGTRQERVAGRGREEGSDAEDDD